MGIEGIREKYLSFFDKRGHTRIKPAPLVPENDPTTLFTSSGMQQLVPYLMGKSHPDGDRLVNSQPSIRLQDIEEVGDNRHTTFFEMLGNWSLGDYFKEEQLAWLFEFLTKELSLSKDRLWVSVFKGNQEVARDSKSAKVWERLGIPRKRIFYYGVEDNWWSRSGPPSKMPPGEIGGPDSEVFFEFRQVKHDPKFGKHCQPSCSCGRFLEIGNSVFIQYLKTKDGKFKELPKKNVDFGGGLERLAAAVADEPDIFKIDLFAPIVRFLEEAVGRSYENRDSQKSFRIIADHLRASVMLLREGLTPSNKRQGYVLRRLIRRSVFHFQLLDVSLDTLPGSVVEILRKAYPNLDWERLPEISDAIKEEGKKFEKALSRGLKKLAKIMSSGKKVNGKFVFDLYQTEGFPFDLTLEILAKKGRKFSNQEKRQFEREFKKHKELSRTASLGMFKSGLVNKSEEATRLHTVTHLLHASLRKILGEQVEQKGSNITAERLRFDFSYDRKISDKEVEKIEKMINEQIRKDLRVSLEIMTLARAKESGALAFFKEKYGEKVRVYTIGSPTNRGWFSKEVCQGPHVTSTGKIGHVRIIKTKRIGVGLMRIYAECSKN